MNFLDFTVNSSLQEELSSLEKQNRLPHAIIINGGNPQQRLDVSLLLSMWAVCSSLEGKPCGICKACQNAKDKIHSDVYFAKGSGKTEIFNVDEMRKINDDTVIKPNSADYKVYIFLDADKRMPVISQNTFLKTLEEPPKNVIFILTTENSTSLLDTILSRATVFNIPINDTPDETALTLAKEIALSIVKSSEIDLLFATGKLTKRAEAINTLNLVSRLLRDGLACAVGGKCTLDDECGKALSKRLTKIRLLKLIELNEKAIIKINQNVNLNLLATWLCGEYRRISWQK